MGSESDYSHFAYLSFGFTSDHASVFLIVHLQNLYVHFPTIQSHLFNCGSLHHSLEMADPLPVAIVCVGMAGEPIMSGIPGRIWG